MPTVERIDQDALHTTLVVHLPKEDYLPKLNDELKKLRHRAQIKGFRPGQVPMPVIKKMYGQSMLIETVNDLTIKQLYGYIQDNKINTLFQPLPSESQERLRFDIHEPADFVFRFEVGLEPEWKIEGLSKDTVCEKLVISNLDELAKDELENARRRSGERTNPTDKIEEGDILKIAAVELGPDKFYKDGGLSTTMTTFVKEIPTAALKTQILGKKQGDVFHFNARELDSFKDEKMYRKYMLSLDEKDERSVGDLFEGTIEEVSRVSPAEVNQEFFDKTFGPDSGISNETEALAKLREFVNLQYENQSEALLMRQFQKDLLQNNQFALPDSFLKRWLATQGQEQERAFSSEEIERAYPAFVENLRWTLIRERLKEQFQIEITDEDIRAEFAKRVAGYFGQNLGSLPPGIVENTANRLMEDEKQRKEVRDNLEFDRLFAGIREQMTITERPINSKAFIALVEEIQQRVEQEDELFAESEA